MNLSMLLFNEETATNSEELQSKLGSSKSFDGTVGVLNENSMDASIADANFNRTLLSLPDATSESERFANRLGKSYTELEKTLSKKPLVGPSRESSFFNSLNAVQPSNPFLQGLALNPGISSLYLPYLTQKRQHKTKREWRNIGTFTSEETMNEVRKRERVSKRKTVVQINGTKVFYRCNNWRRTNCNFRMHAVIHAPDRITLYASGEHDHTIKNPQYQPRTYTGSSMHYSPPCSSQQQVLNQFVANVTANSSHLLEPYDQENAFGEVNNNLPSQKLKNALKDISYHLSDGPRIAALLQVAAELGHSFKFNSRGTREYCIESNKPVSRGKMLVLIDHGAFISVTERIHGFNGKSETWKKADWQQFLYAVRGKCRAVLS